jgi:putative ABC transport system permease protein
MFEYIFCAFRNVGRKKLRTILTVMGIAIGVASVIIIGAIGEGGKNAVTAQLDSLGVNGLDIRTQADSTGLQAPILLDDVKACASIKGVESVMPVIMNLGTSISRNITKDILVWGVGSNAESIISLKMLHGKMFTSSEVKSHAKVCLVDENFAKTLYKRSNITGKTLTVYLGNGYQNLTVAGVVEQGSSVLYNLVGNYMPSFIYVPFTTAEDLKGKIGYDQIAIKTKSDDNLDAQGQKIVTELDKGHNGDTIFVADNMLKQKQKMSDLLSIVTLIVSAIGAISLIVAGLSIMTVMSVSVSERTREIGIKKAIGAKNRIILVEFLLEAFIISAIGGLVGIIFGSGISMIASIILNISLTLNIHSIIVCTCFVAAIGIIFGVYPAIKASKMKPVDALRHDY